MSDLWTELGRWPAGDSSAWRRSVDEALKGRDYETTLVTETPEGLPLSPLYTRADLPPGAATDVPGRAPFTRGFPAPAGTAAPRRGWLRSVDIDHPAVAVANEMLLGDLEGGAERATVRVRSAANGLRELTTTGPGAAAAGRGGVWIETENDIDRLLAGVHWSLAPVVLQAPAAEPALTRRLFAHCAALRARDGQGGLGAQVDVTTLAWTADDAATWLADAADLISAEAERALAPGVAWADARPLSIATTGLRSAGADLVQEVAAAVALFVSVTRALDGLVTPAAVLRACEFRLGVGADFFGEIAKLRAFRRGLALVLATLGLGERAADVFVAAASAEETLQRRDPHVNLLRTTAQAAASVFGGADAVVVAPFDARLGGGTDGRRLARNLHGLLAEESDAGAVADPAGGSFYIEHRTERIAEAAWAQFVAWEQAGGFVQACIDGVVPKDIERRASAAASQRRTRRRPVLGVSVFAPPDDTPAARQDSDDAAFVESWRRRLGDDVAGRAGAPPRARALPVRHDGDDFERLRDIADAHLARRGSRPTVVAAVVGDPASCAARLDWVRDLLAAGGIQMDVHGVSDTPPGAVPAAIAASRGPVILVAADAIHGTAVPALASALRAGSTRRIVVAGRPGAHAQAQRDAGVTDHVFAGADAVSFLEMLLDDIEAAHAAA